MLSGKGGSRDIENMLKYLQDSRNVIVLCALHLLASRSQSVEEFAQKIDE